MNSNRLNHWFGSDLSDTESDYAADAEVLLKELSNQQVEMGQAVVKGLAKVSSKIADSLYSMHHTHPYRSLAIASGLGLLAGMIVSALCQREKSS